MPTHANQHGGTHHAGCDECKRSRAAQQGATTKANSRAEIFKVEVERWLLGVETEIKMPWPQEEPQVSGRRRKLSTGDRVRHHLEAVKPYVVQVTKERDTLKTSNDGLKKKVKENKVLLGHVRATPRGAQGNS
ncbi:hypothetical protein ONZ45_g6437 [Pleurotus djamor]|nr:hypothetical protein ONZ45_g6437 [Pleurotus djamor]